MSVVVVIGKAYEDSTVALMGRIVDADGNIVVPEDITTISVQMFNKLTGVTVLAATTLDPADVLFDELQTPEVWTADTVGFNFRYDAAPLADGETWYRFEFKFTPVVGNVFHAVFDVKTEGLMRS